MSATERRNYFFTAQWILFTYTNILPEEYSKLITSHIFAPHYRGEHISLFLIILQPRQGSDGCLICQHSLNTNIIPFIWQNKCIIITIYDSPALITITDLFNVRMCTQTSQTKPPQIILKAVMCCSSQRGTKPGSRSSTAPRARGSSGLSAPGLWLSSVDSLPPQSWDHWECRPSSPGCSPLSGWCCMHAFLEMSDSPNLMCKNNVNPKIKFKVASSCCFGGSELLIANWRLWQKSDSNMSLQLFFIGVISFLNGE